MHFILGTSDLPFVPVGTQGRAATLITTYKEDDTYQMMLCRIFTQIGS